MSRVLTVDCNNNVYSVYFGQKHLVKAEIDISMLITSITTVCNHVETLKAVLNHDTDSLSHDTCKVLVAQWRATSLLVKTVGVPVG